MKTTTRPRLSKVGSPATKHLVTFTGWLASGSTPFHHRVVLNQGTGRNTARFEKLFCIRSGGIEKKKHHPNLCI